MIELLLLILTKDLVNPCVILDNRQDVIYQRMEKDITTNCGPDDPIPPNRVNTSLELTMVREEMIKFNINAIIVPLDEDGRLQWISGFSGSNGEAVITQDQALLWTDGRYFIQAAKQLDCNWELMKMGEEGTPTVATWVSLLGVGTFAGADPTLVGAGTWLEMEDILNKEKVELITIPNLIDFLWTEDDGRPPTVKKDIVVHHLDFAGESWGDKVSRLRVALIEEDMFGMIVTELDEVAWLFNLRGEGQSSNMGLLHSPTFKSLALVTIQEIIIWIHSEKITEAVLNHLKPPGCSTNNINNCIILKDYEESLSDIEIWAQSQDNTGQVLVTKPSSYLSGANYAVYRTLPEEIKELASSPVINMKAVKNPTEISGMLAAHERDALALCDWAAFMEDQIEISGVNNWTEISAAENLAEYRYIQKDNKGLSFGTISAFGPNGAIIHYSPTPETDRTITKESLLMVDSGGQYLDGTTDVTRTFHYGQPSKEMIDRYTDVLRGSIDLARLIVPDGTQDSAIDLATRQYLFSNSLDYRHGTGHGIGAYLEVHEGPILVRMSNSNPGKFKTGMFFSDEPGYYKEGDFGMRLETILMVVDHNVVDSEYGKFIRFEPVTLVPFEPKLIDYASLSLDQIEWLNMYNTRIMERVGTRLLEEGNTRAYNWVNSRCQWIDPQM